MLLLFQLLQDRLKILIVTDLAMNSTVISLFRNFLAMCAFTPGSCLNVDRCSFGDEYRYPHTYRNYPIGVRCEIFKPLSICSLISCSSLPSLVDDDLMPMHVYSTRCSNRSMSKLTTGTRVLYGYRLTVSIHLKPYRSRRFSRIDILRTVGTTGSSRRRQLYSKPHSVVRFDTLYG